jgi:hypothetical protein
VRSFPSTRAVSNLQHSDLEHREPQLSMTGADGVDVEAIEFHESKRK